MGKANAGPLMRTLFVTAICGFISTACAETLLFTSFQIELDDNWMHSSESGPQANSALGDSIKLYHPHRDGTLSLQTYNAPDVVSNERLRNLTNVDSSTPLALQYWGEFSGYQYDYSEGGSFYRQWWLANERTILFIVYDTMSEPSDIEIDEINKIVTSVRLNTP